MLRYVLAVGLILVVPAAPTHVVIMHTNDIHGQLLPRNGGGGIAEMATIIREARPDLVFDAGDLFTGTFLSDEFKGQPTIQAMNKIGYTSGTVGNHEFDYGQAALRVRLREAKFPVLSANLTTPISEIKKYTIVTAKGIRFGVIGLTTEEIVTTTHPRNLNGVKAHAIVKTLQQLMPEVRGKSDFIVVTAHLNDEEEKRIVAAFPDLRLIIGGHVHAALGPIWIGQTLIGKTGSVGRNVGRIDLDFEGKTLTHIEGKLIPVMDVPADPEIAKIVAPFEAKVSVKMNEVIGEAADEFTNPRDAESPLGDLIADAYREKGKTQIGLQNIGGIRARLAKGPITWGSAFEVLPFQNTLVTLKVTGAQLKKTLAVEVVALSGLKAHYDISKAAGQRLVSVTLADGTPIEDAKLYSITTNDFVVAGGDGFTELAKGVDIKDSGSLLRDVLVNYIKAKRVIIPSTDGRITVSDKSSDLHPNDFCCVDALSSCRALFFTSDANAVV